MLGAGDGYNKRLHDATGVKREAYSRLNIYDFSSLTIPAAGLDNRTEWLPALDEFRNFCYSPQAALEPVISDIDRFSVA
jgi:hypothetical protein